MAISNCLLSPTSENPRRFYAWCVLAKLNTKPRNYLYPNRFQHLKNKTLKVQVRFSNAYLS